MLTSPMLGQTLGTPDGDFQIAEWTEGPCPPDGPLWVAPLHRHLECDEAWYVLEGTLVVRCGDEDHIVPAGSAAFVPRGMPHTYWNPNPAPVRYLLIMTAKTAALIEAIHSTEDRSPEGLRALFAKYDAEFLGWR